MQETSRAQCPDFFTHNLHEKGSFLKHYFYALGAILCWASLPAATGSGLKGLDVEALMFFSFTSAALFLYVQDVAVTRSFRLHIPNLKISLLGVWGIFLYHLVYYHALARTPLAEGAILTTTWSFWIVVFSSVVMFKKLTMGTMITALVGMFGAALVISTDKPVSFDMENTAGYGLALLCGLLWSSFSVALGRMNLKKDPMTAFTLYAAILSAIIYVATMPHATPSPQELRSAVYLGCVPLGLSFFLWNKALSGGNMVVIGFLSYLTPPLAVLMVAILHGESISARLLLGMVIITAAAVGGRMSLPQSS